MPHQVLEHWPTLRKYTHIFIAMPLGPLHHRITSPGTDLIAQTTADALSLINFRLIGRGNIDAECLRGADTDTGPTTTAEIVVDDF
jgi:hypothetical protein